MFEIQDDFEVETDRLILRVFHPNDITEKYLDALNQRSIIGLTEARHHNWSRKKAVEFIVNTNKPSESTLFGVFLKSDDKPIGNIRLFNFHKVHMRAELSFLFYDSDEWGKGYATEAIEAVIKYAFDILNLHRIYADYYEVNIASERVFSKLGFQIEGVYKDHFWLEDRFVDSVRVAKLTDTFL
jgi:[ribosomal protein S5]-alanine N-acetyltransferase